MTFTVDVKKIQSHATNVYNVSDAFATPIGLLNRIGTDEMSHAFGKLCGPILVPAFKEAESVAHQALPAVQSGITHYGAVARQVGNEYLGLDELTSAEIGNAGKRVFGIRQNKLDGTEPGSAYVGRKLPTIDDLEKETDHGKTHIGFHAPGVVPNPVMPGVIPVTTKEVPYGLREGGNTFSEKGTGGWLEGASFLSTAWEVRRAVTNGSIVDKDSSATNTVNSMITMAGAAGAAADPVGTLLSGIDGWILEHIEPFPTYLDWFAGDPDEANALAKSWTAMGTEVGRLGDDLYYYVQHDLTGVKTEAFYSYRNSIFDKINGIAGFEEFGKAVGDAIALAATIVGTVRAAVRSIAAEVISEVQKIALKIAVPGLSSAAANEIAGIVGRLGPKALKWINMGIRVARALVSGLRRLNKLTGKYSGVWTRTLPAAPPLVQPPSP